VIQGQASQSLQPNNKVIKSQAKLTGNLSKVEAGNRPQSNVTVRCRQRERPTRDFGI
jgi:hypothetical protein